jgi:hypothetical protein
VDAFYTPRMSKPLGSASTSQIVGLPHLPELFDPNYLDALLPAKPAAVDASEPPRADATPTNPLMEALKEDAKIANASTRTDNGDPAFSSTGSATLDAFQALAPQSDTGKLDLLLKDAWKEDPTLTLHIIWNARSIHDGKGERELFYQ